MGNCARRGMLLVALVLVHVALATNITPGRPFNYTAAVGPDSPVLLKFEFNGTFSPRLTTSLRADETLQTSVSVLVSDACVASAYSIPSLDSRQDSCFSVQDSRSLCQNACPVQGKFSMALSSYTAQNVSILVDLEDISLIMGVPRTVTVRSWSPVYLRFDFDDFVMDSVEFQIRSDSSTVAIVSVQNESCPVFDLPDNVAFQVKEQGFSMYISRRCPISLFRTFYPPSVSYYPRLLHERATR
jgi:hypothetical protein